MQPTAREAVKEDGTITIFNDSMDIWTTYKLVNDQWELVAVDLEECEDWHLCMLENTRLYYTDAKRKETVKDSWRNIPEDSKFERPAWGKVKDTIRQWAAWDSGQGTPYH